MSGSAAAQAVPETGTPHYDAFETPPAAAAAPDAGPVAPRDEPAAADGAPMNRDAIMRIPVKVQVVLGSATMPVARLMNLGRGAIVPLDHRVGEPVQVVVNGRLIARGEIVVMEEDNARLGVSLTEIVSSAASNRSG